MAKKKKVARRKKKALVRGKSPRRGKVALTGQSLRLSAKQAVVLVQRTAGAHMESAAELEAARLKREEVEQELGRFYAAEAAKEARPFYNFLAQGDSWFDYTCGVALIPYLVEFFRPQNAYFKNIAKSGRTLRQMLSREFKAKLAAGAPNGAPWNGVLLSGGGNDICGNHRFRDWLIPYDGATHPADYYIAEAFKGEHGELAILKGIYEETVDLIRHTAGGVRLFVHDYDFAIPDNRCVTGHSPHLEADFRFCFAGPWMGPAFEERGFHRPGEPVSQLTKDIVRAILTRFSHMLAGLERTYPNQLVLVHTQGVLTPTQATELWVNELHPYNESFRLLARPFYEKLCSYL